LLNLSYEYFTGGIFDEEDGLQQAVLKSAVERVNLDRDILPDYRLSVREETIPHKSSFHTTRAGDF